MPLNSDEWWHLFLSENEGMGAVVTTIFGESSQLPTEAKKTALGFDPPIYWVHSFDHDPDEDEVDVVIKDRLLKRLVREAS